MNDAPPPTTTRRTLLAGMALIAGAGALPARAEQSQAMNVVLLGDSIFDNKAYVGDGPDVIKQLSAALPVGRDRHARRAGRLDHQRHRGPARRHAERRDPPRRLGRRQ